jgi:hypothetical protein
MCTTYADAPSTILLATHCCMCNRPLVDAESVERGMGPTCAENHGVGDASELPSWGDAAKAVELALGADARQLVPGFWAAALDGDARRASNVLVARIAVRPDAVDAAGLVVAVHELGFVLLARRLTERLLEASAVRIDVDGDALLVTAPYSPAFNDALRTSAPARRWDRDAKVWRVPASSKRGLWTALRAAFPGRPLVSAKGVALIAA